MIETLAPIERAAGSEGERQAAEWIAERLSAAGADAQVEESEVPRRLGRGDRGALAALGVASGLLAAQRWSRRPGSPARSPRRG